MPLRPLTASHSRFDLAAGRARRGRSRGPAILDALAFSSTLAAAVGAGLSLFASRALDAPDAARWASLTAGGAFIIYNLDRLRDVERDRATSPSRTRFIERHRTILILGVVSASLVFFTALIGAPRSAQALCAGIGSVGLLHRRLKEHPALKTVYVSAAWVAACVGMPWLAAGRPVEGLWLAGSLAAVLAANLIASNLRDDETQLSRTRLRTMLAIALALTAVGMAIALISPGASAAAGWIALLECLALTGFRAEERYGLLVIDGALLVGSGLAWLQIGGPA
jgi:hypothetical protein